MSRRLFLNRLVHASERCLRSREDGNYSPMSTTSSKRGLLVAALTLVSLVLLVAIYYQPIWWVSLKAPNYPPEAFPDGVRIHFHMNGVFNGCTLQARREVVEEHALDCVHEMDAINHFVGMFPIASGGVIEKAYSPFLLSFLGVMLLGFLIRRPPLRLAVMAAGFAGIAVWMWLTFYSTNGLAYQSAGYLDAMVTSLGQGQEEEGEEQSPVIAALKKSLLASGIGAVADRSALVKGVEQAGEGKLSEALKRLHEGSQSATAGQGSRSLREILAEAGRSTLTGKALSLDILKSAYEADQRRKPEAERVAWNGSGAQALAWHHEKSLGRWFNDPKTNRPLAERTSLIASVLFWVILAGMLAMLFAGRNNGPLHWLLIVVPILMPAFFIVEYAAWLWWYGHSLNEMGAFTLKPFMPTVFGQGKVAQFSTHSYPHRGFGLMVLMSLLLTFAALIRRKQMIEESKGGR
jgi:hypothetical protein